MKKTPYEKIETIKAAIEKSEKKISEEKAKIESYKKELDTLESLEVKAMLKELDMPFEEVKQFLNKLKKSNTPEQTK